MKLSDEMIYALTQMNLKGVRTCSNTGCSYRTFEALKRRGMADNSRGSWSITEAGRNALTKLLQPVQ